MVRFAEWAFSATLPSAPWSSLNQSPFVCQRHPARYLFVSLFKLIPKAKSNCAFSTGVEPMITWK